MFKKRRFKKTNFLCISTLKLIHLKYYLPYFIYMKPVIFRKSKIGKNKFENVLKKDADIKNKEIQLLSVPGKGIHDVSNNRQKNHVGKNTAKLERILNEKIKENIRRKIRNLENRAQLLHTHITKRNSKREEYGIALPSLSDIVSFIKDRKRTIKYQIISVIDPKNGRPIGYTTIRINNIKVTPEQFIEKINPYLNSKNKKNAEYKIHLFEMLPSLGMEIVFTPETGYRLDNRFNYIREK